MYKPTARLASSLHHSEPLIAAIFPCEPLHFFLRWRHQIIRPQACNYRRHRCLREVKRPRISLWKWRSNAKFCCFSSFFFPVVGCPVEGASLCAPMIELLHYELRSVAEYQSLAIIGGKSGTNNNHYVASYDELLTNHRADMQETDKERARPVKEELRWRLKSGHAL